MHNLEFTEFCDRYRIEYRTTGKHTRRGWVQIRCPYCGTDGDSFHMGFCLSWPRVHCWKCGKHPLAKTLKMITGEAEAKIHAIVSGFPREKPIHPEGAKGILTLPQGLKPMGRAHTDYLRSRNFNPRTIERVWGVQGLGLGAGYKTEKGRINLSWRLFIPIEVGGVLSSWTTRSIADNPSIRYISATAEHERICHKELLYGEDYAGSTIIIVEGPTKSWRIGPGAVCTFGTRPTPAQIVRMGRYSKRYVLFDHGAERYSQALVQQLSMFPGETYEITTDAADVEESTKSELSSIRRLLE